MNIFATIKEKQKELELTNDDFAKYLGVSRQWVVNLHSSNFEERPFRRKTMYIISNKCGIPIEDIEEYNRAFVEVEKDNK